MASLLRRAQAFPRSVVTTPVLPKAVVQPTYDRSTLEPSIVHFGVGGFHRSHMAVYLDELLEKRLSNWSIVGVGIKAPYDKAMRDALVENDFKYTLIERDDTTCNMRVIGSITDYIYTPESAEAVQAVLTKLTDARIRLVSLTITEGGYFTNATGEFDFTHPDIVHDVENPDSPVTVFGFIVEALNRRRALGLSPFTVMSCDNLQSNGDVVKNAVLSFASLRSAELRAWIEEHGRFPNTMVDRITPQTKEGDKMIVKEQGLKDAWPVVAEPFKQWVIEDKFCNGERPPFELVGVQFTDEILPYELMKLRLLNASHSSMAYLGFLSGFTLVHDLMRDPTFKSYITHLMSEVEPLLPVPHGVDLKAYQASLINRFSNSTLNDQISRLCFDGSAKMPKFIAPSILEYSKHHSNSEKEQENTKKTKLPIALLLAVASWVRYLDRVDENGNEFKVLDPMADELKELSSREVLKHESIFGELSKCDEFVETVLALVEKLRTHGARSVLAEVVGSLNPAAAAKEDSVVYTC